MQLCCVCIYSYRSSYKKDDTCATDNALSTVNTSLEKQKVEISVLSVAFFCFNFQVNVKKSVVRKHIIVNAVRFVHNDKGCLLKLSFVSGMFPHSSTNSSGIFMYTPCPCSCSKRYLSVDDAQCPLFVTITHLHYKMK